ncbi:MAG: hypothetical protein WCV93_04315 [Candidatus Shapirobacteria bacterium]|jgi:hypothetical protein
MHFVFHYLRQKPLDFVLLFLFFAICLVSFFVFGIDGHSRRSIVYITAGGYFLWSLAYHYRRGDLHPSIIIEYLVMALLGTIVLSTTLF